MEISKEHLKKAGKGAGALGVGAGLGAAGFTALDDSPTKDEVENLEETKQELQEKLSDRPTEEEVKELNNQVDNLKERPTAEKYAELQKQLGERFTQEEVDELVADATEREDLVEFLPVLADEDVEIESLDSRKDEEAKDSNLNKDVPAVEDDFDDDEFEGEDFDEVRATYNHDEGHDYNVVVREFEDSEDAEVYEDGLRDAVEDEEYDESLTEDAEVIRDGDTVVYVYGNADEEDYDSYDFEAVAGQY